MLSIPLLSGGHAGGLRRSQCLLEPEDIPLLARAHPLQLLESHLCADVDLSVVLVELCPTVAKLPRLHTSNLHTQATSISQGKQRNCLA